LCSHIAHSDHHTDVFYDTAVLPLTIELMLSSGWRLSGSSSQRISDTESMEVYIFYRTDAPIGETDAHIIPPEVPLPAAVTHALEASTKAINNATAPGVDDIRSASSQEQEVPATVPLLGNASKK
jgi:hypothetical protein